MRQTIRTLSLIAGIGIATSTASLAADLGKRPIHKAPPIAPTFNWTGFYIGAHVGYGWGNSDWDVDLSVKNDGVVGGGQIGYNWQVAPNWVLGLEADMSGSGMKGSSSCVSGIVTCSNDIAWLATVTGRAGYSFDRALVYAKGGLAVMDQDLTISGPGSSATESSGTRTGWTVGGGIEYAFAPAWSAKVEYNYMDFGSKNVGGLDVDQTVNAVKVGVNYRFGVMPFGF